jgi:hypothetical protein
MDIRIGQFLGLAAIATLCLAPPVVAREIQSGGVPPNSNVMMGGGPSVPALPMAQRPMAGGGFGGSPLVSTNVGVGTNVAAGLGNSAEQQFAARQSGMPMVSVDPRVILDMSGRGPLVTTNVGVGTNVAAGLGNLATQMPGSRER